MERIHVRKEDLLNFINGHAQANKLIDDERKERLSQLTKEESLREYIALCEFWERVSYKEISPEFEKQRISFLIKTRELLNLAGHLKNE